MSRRVLAYPLYSTQNLLSLKILDSQIQFKKYTSGDVAKPALILFHGYAQSVDSFSPHLLFLQKDFNLYFVSWRQINDLDVLIDFVKNLEEEKRHLLGYSIGAKWVLSLLSTDLDITELYLIAPDGVHTHWLYWLCTKTMIGRRIFDWVCARPQRLKGLLRWASRCRPFRKPALYAQRLDLGVLHSTWIQCSQLQIARPIIRQKLSQGQVKLNIWIGSHDVIIDPQPIRRFAQKHLQVQLTTVSKGHYDILRQFEDIF